MTPAETVLGLCARIATHTDVPGTIVRTFLSPATHGVHALLRAEMEALGMTVRVDAVGNVRGMREGATPDAPVLLMGSHIDTVPNAGAYDGILGVALPLMLLILLQGRRLPYAIELIAFSEEEGVRFKLPFIGSRSLLGDLGAQDLARTDADGVDVAEAIRKFGLDPGQLANCAMTPGTFAFFEVHIEQGPVLESLNLPLGIVETIVGQTRQEITFGGEANHAGTTPMSLRRDALTGAAEFITYAEEFARRAEGLVATVGGIQATPGAANIIPGKVTLSLDVRHAEDANREHAVRELLAQSNQIAEARCLQVQHRETSTQASTALDAKLQAALAQAAGVAGVQAHSMASGAGHDAMILARRVPSAMLFMRSPGGVSHSPAESVRLDDIAAALDVCMRFLTTLEPPR